MTKNFHKVYIGSFFLVGIATVILLTINGFDYYTTPLEERFFNPNNELLKPSGVIGHGVGILGSLMMIFGVALYMVRKRVRGFFNMGYLKHWLEFHIFLCTVGPILVLFHTAFKFGGIVAISFWSMVAVVLSGVIGRFIYVQIPRTIQGNELDIKQISEMSSDISLQLFNELPKGERIAFKVEQLTSANYNKNINFGKSVPYVIKDFFNVRSTLSELKKEMHKINIPKLKIKEVLKLARSKMILARKIRMLKTMQRLFRYWHIVHLPFAITMFVIMLIHVAVTIIFGYRWIF
jgi:hypothetical protein